MGKASKQWKSIKNFSRYEISESGEMRTAYKLKTRPKGYFLKGTINGEGYMYYKLINDAGEKVVISTHRLVAFAFLGEQPTEKHQVAHNDGNKLNNHYLNLRWATPQENTNDKFKHQTILYGENNPRALLTFDDVIQAKKEYQGKYGDIAKLARRYNVSHTTMLYAIQGKNWRKLS